MLEQAASLDEDPREILGLSVRVGTRSDIAAALAARITAGQSTRVAFLNAHLSNLCARLPHLKRDLGGFLLLNDGIGLDIASLVLHGRKFPANLNGTDFTSGLLSESGHGWRIFCLGARADVMTRASAIIARRWPQHDVVGSCDGYFDDGDELSRRILDLKPDLVIVGMGNPIQERWIAFNIPTICPAAVAVGAWFDFLTGAVQRAPIWVQRARCEWLFRLITEPRRLASRYLLGNPLFLYRVAIAFLSRSRVQEAPGCDTKLP